MTALDAQDLHVHSVPLTATSVFNQRKDMLHGVSLVSLRPGPPCKVSFDDEN
jgi:hypothetical protein